MFGLDPVELGLNMKLGMFGLDPFQLYGNFLPRRNVGTKVNVSKGSTTNLPPQPVLVPHPQLYDDQLHQLPPQLKLLDHITELQGSDGSFEPQNTNLRKVKNLLCSMTTNYTSYPR